MRITDFHRTKLGRIALYVEEEFAFSMHPDVFAASGLSVGMDLTEEQLEELRCEAQLKRAKEKALNLLSAKEYTSAELRTKLRREVDEDTAQQAVERMQEIGLIDDDDYAERFARDLSQRKRYGPMRVKQEMRRKGLSDEQISFATSLLQEDDEDIRQKIRAILEKKYPMAWEDEKVKRRAFAALLRLGYAPGDVRRALREDEYYD